MLLHNCRRSASSEFHHLFKLLVPEKTLLMKFAFSLTVSSGVSLCFPLALQDIYNLCAVPTTSQHEIVRVVGKWTAVFGAGALSTYMRRLAIEDLSNTVAMKMRIEFFEDLLRKKYQVFGENTTGDLSHQLNSDIWTIAYTITNEFSSAMRGVAFFTGGAGFLLYTCPPLTMISLFPMMALASISKYYGNLLRRERETQAIYLRQLNSFAQERLVQIKTIKHFTAEGIELKKYAEKQTKVYNKAIDVARYSAKHHALMEAMGQNAVLWCLGYGAYLISTGSGLSVGALTAFAMYSVYAGLGFRLLASGYTELKKAAGVYNKILETKSSIDDKEEILISPTILPKSTVGPSIIFKNVSFTYPGREIPVLDNINLEIKSGEIWGIVGPSGCGKSTLFHLLTHLYAPTSGLIYIDNVDIHTKPAWWARQQISIVSQEAPLFSGSILDNIKYSNPNATMEEVIDACKRADAYDFINNFEDKFDSEVGEGGSALSGGQKQRVAIARALLKTPHMLLLDEATSGLDHQSEKTVQGILEREVKNRGFTVLLISHKIRTLKALTDRIAVLHAGKIIATGTFDELKESKHI
ncbi:unnamed protein product [Blepharisma stoltei]|uniref:Uncharacterized protein n=1 Tax=Blepharisma stoltei TaxID=1481888 RepID=A0AAU9JJJ8_9CILI|nr:unnamed protein product [Blepharisma stoltei]